MKLVRDNTSGGHAVQVICRVCGKRFTLSEGYADIEGEPWVDYYCGTCAPEGEAIRSSRRDELGRERLK